MSERTPTDVLVAQARVAFEEEGRRQTVDFVRLRNATFALADRLAEVAALAEAIRSERAAPHQGPPPPPHR